LFDKKILLSKHIPPEDHSLLTILHSFWPCNPEVNLPAMIYFFILGDPFESNFTLFHLERKPIKYSYRVASLQEQLLINQVR